jgi:hypothetical protein
MSDRAQDPSLSVQIAQLRALVEELRAQQERKDRIREILAGAGTPSPPLRPRGGHRKDRRHLRVIPGGLAACVPLVLLFGDGSARALPVAVWRWMWKAKTDHVRWVAASVLLGAACSVLAPAVPQDNGARPAVHVHAVAHYRPVHRRAVP